MEEKTVKVKINGKEYEFPAGITILKACEKVGIHIPTLCYLEGVSEEGSCGVCVVEVKGARTLQRSCITELLEGMEIYTDTPAVKEAREMNLELALAHHPLDCMTCDKNGDCLLQDLAYEFNVKKSVFLDESEIYEKEKQTAWDTNPFIQFDPQKCILCRRCVDACENQAIVEAIGIAMRGIDEKVTTPFNLPLEQTNCQFCGECVQACPTGALIEKPRIGKGRIYDFKATDTVCSYCGVGCNIRLYTDKNNNIVMAKGLPNKLVNDTRTCVKGRFGFEYVNSKDRLTSPLIKENGKFRKASWDEAIQYIARKLTEIKNKYGSDSIGVLGSSRCTNEDNYVVQKFARAVIGTNNVDNCARLCHSSTVTGLKMALGAGAATNSIDDIKDADVMFIIGSNMTETHPVIAQIVKKHQKDDGAKIIVCDPRKTDIAKVADVFIQHNPGTDVALLNAIMKIIIDEDLVDEEFIKEHAVGFEQLKEELKDFDLSEASKITGVDLNLIKQAAEIYGQAKNATIFYTMGITQHTTGTDNVLSIANLALITGNLGREGAGINPLRGQANVQGACDLGALPNVFPGYQSVTDESVREKFEQAWGVKLPKDVGLPVSKFGEAALSGKLKAVYVMGENPLMSEPDINRVREGFEKLEFIVVQDIFLSETAQIADVVLPAAAAYEKDGTFTNTERRVQLLRVAKEKLKGTKFDWEIVSEVASAMGYPMHYKNSAEIMDEAASLTLSYAGIHHYRLEKQGIQWPCKDDSDPGTKILHRNGHFNKPNGRGVIHAVKFKPPAELPDKEYPFVLTTGRILYHYHTGNESRRVKVLDEFVPENYIEISKKDADKLNLKDGEIVKVTTRRGSIKVKTRVSDRPKEGVVFVSFHFHEAAANILTNPALDPIANIPEYKVAACRIEKV